MLSFFSIPLKRYFNFHSLPPLLVTSRYSPSPSKSLRSLCGFRGHRAQHSDLIARSVPRIVRAGFRNDRAQFEVWSA